jgi:beta-glucosidase
MSRLLLLIAFLSMLAPVKSQVYRDPGAPVEDRVNSLLLTITTDEKLSYIGGVDGFYIRDIPRLGLPKIKMSDGPVGVRTWGQTTAYPAGICNAATWDTALVNKLGRALGRDARARGVHILLAPGVNIYRAPMCGRNFEYFGEDPFLSGQMAVQYVRGVQSQRVVATVKHFAGNNQEYDRYNVSSDIDERTLQEIYLPAFRAAVIQGKAGAVMNAYNLLNGIHCTQNIHLNNEILKGQWHFKGILMSDWGSTHDAVAAANGGLDLEMPSGDNMSPANMATALNTGSVTMNTIDDKVRRIARTIFSFGFYDNPQTDGSIPADDPENDTIALQLARGGIVLLKNDSILPLSVSAIKSLAVIGPNANQYVAGGGSSYPDPFHSISVLQGLTTLVGSTVSINFAGTPDIFTQAGKSIFYKSPGSIVRGLTASYFANQILSLPVYTTRIDTIIDFHWPNAPDILGMPADHFSIRWTGVIRPLTSGTYTFSVRGDDGYRLWINNQLIIDNWTDHAATTTSGNIDLVSGQEYPVKLEYYENGGLAEITLAYQSQAELNQQIVSAAAASDVAIVCAGFNSSTEGEGSDRPFDLGALQDSLITAVAKANPNTIVVLNAGGNVDMSSWIYKIRGLLHAWYPGQDGGKAVAEILFGKTNPSGRLPASFEKKWSDNPVYANYYPNNGNFNINYNEGLFVGYRYYDANQVTPMFPFGYGLSYTTFSYSGMSYATDTAGRVIVTCSIKNTGKMKGAEVVQLYVGPVSPKVVRPVKELKGFSKVELLPGETKLVSIVLDLSSFSYYSTAAQDFVVDKGNYDLIIGSSSREEKLRQTIFIDHDSIFSGIKQTPAAQVGVSVYPVPANHYVIFEKNNPADVMESIRIYDANGRLVDNLNCSGGRYHYDCSGLPDGTYYCKVFSARGITDARFIIKKQ